MLWPPLNATAVGTQAAMRTTSRRIRATAKAGPAAAETLDLSFANLGTHRVIGGPARLPISSEFRFGGELGCDAGAHDPARTRLRIRSTRAASKRWGAVALVGSARAPTAAVVSVELDDSQPPCRARPTTASPRRTTRRLRRRAQQARRCYRFGRRRSSGRGVRGACASALTGLLEQAAVRGGASSKRQSTARFDAAAPGRRQGDAPIRGAIVSLADRQ